MSRYGYESDENSWGQRTSCDVDDMRRREAKDSLGIFEPVSSDDVCDPQCAKWERDWRKQTLAAKGLREFDGTGETIKDGVPFTEGMYEDQTAGKNYGRKY